MENKIINLIDTLYLKINRMRNRSYNFNGTPYYPVEVQILGEFESNSSVGVAILSEKFQVTKGAVSQKIKSLCQKEYLFLDRQEGRRKYYKVGTKGKMLLDHHRLRFNDFVTGMEGCLKSIASRDLTGCRNTLEQFIRFLDEKDRSEE